MKITLVRGNERSDPLTPIEESNVTGIYPPLGIAYVARALLNKGYDVRIIDAHAFNLNPAEIAFLLFQRRDAVVGITSTSLNWLRTLRIIAAIKKVYPEIKIVVGGPHLALFAPQAVAMPGIDAAVVGEGEYAFPDLMAAYENDREPKAIPGIVYKDENGIVRSNEARAPISDLDALDFPAYELLPHHRYQALTIKKPFFTMISSRGCPFSCGFCSQIYAGGAFRQRSPESVVAEMEWYARDHSAREIIMFDETFSIGEERVLQICDHILRRNLHFRWNIRARADTLTAEMCKALKRAGCYGVHIGVESGNAAILKKMMKEITLEQVEQAFHLAREAGLETRGYFMLGYPGDTLQTMEQTVRFSLRLPLDWASYSITVPHPATAIFEEAVAQGLVSQEYWIAYTQGTPLGSLPYFTTDEYDRTALERIKKNAYTRFYLKPTTIFRKLVSPRLWLNTIELLHVLYSLKKQQY